MSASNNKKEAFGGFNSIEERDAAGYQAEGEDAVSLGELEEAEDFFYKALDLRLKIYGPDEPKTGDSFYSLGDVQRKLGRLHEAAGHTQEAIDILSIEGGVKAALARESMGRILEALGLHGPAKEIRLRGYPDYMSCGCVSCQAGVFELEKLKQCSRCKVNIIAEQPPIPSNNSMKVRVLLFEEVSEIRLGRET